MSPLALTRALSPLFAALLATAAGAATTPAGPQDSLPAPLRSLETHLVPTGPQFDRPGDGNLWVRGATYKARFGPDGVEFIPFLGSSAPSNYPVRLSLDSVTAGTAGTAGETSLHLARGVEPVRETVGGVELVSYDRGDLVEYYVVDEGWIEQRFRLDRPVAGAQGELVVRVAVDSELGCSEDADGFCFANELGGVRYGRATTFDQLGYAAPSPTRRTAGGIEIRVPADFLSEAEYPLTVDPIISPFSTYPPSLVATYPDIAYDETNQVYGVVWSHAFSQVDTDVYQQLHQLDGAPIFGSAVWIDATTDRWSYPKIANNGAADNFLVVAVEGSTGVGEIWGRTRDAGSTAMGIQKRIDRNQYVASEPDVGGDPDPDGPSFYFVVFTKDAPNGKRVSGQAVTPDGDPLGTFNAAVSMHHGAEWPSISNSNGVGPRSTKRWTVAWQRQVGNDWDIWGRQYDADVERIDDPFPIDNSAAFDRAPSVSSVLDGSAGSRPYLVTYMTGQTTGNLRVHGKLMADETPLGNRRRHPRPRIGCLIERRPPAAVRGPATARASSSPTPSSRPPRPGTSTFPSSTTRVGPSFPSRRAGPRARPTGTSSGLGCVPAGTAEDPPWTSGSSGKTSSTPPPPMSKARSCRAADSGTCTATSLPNSSGFQAMLHAEGSRSAGERNMTLVATHCPPGRPGLFFLGLAQVDLPFGDGKRCVGGPIKRMHPFVTTDASGTGRLQLDFDAGYASVFAAGHYAINYQYWFRDPSGPSGFNLTGGLHVDHTP